MDQEDKKQYESKVCQFDSTRIFICGRPATGRLSNGEYGCEEHIALRKELAAKNLCKCIVCPGGPFGSFNSYRCSKPAKGELRNGTKACGIHLAAEKRQQKSSEKWHAKYEKEKEFRKLVETFAEERGTKSLRATDYEKGLVSMSFVELQEILKNR